MFMRRMGCALVCVALLTAAPRLRVGAQDAAATPTGNAILARVKAGLRARERPPYVVYTVARRDTLDGLPDLLNSYRLRIWCRTTDSAALSREISGSRAAGAAMFIRPEFDKPIDPGPPTADLLDIVAQSSGPATPAPSFPVIGSVSAFVETNYHVTYAGIDGADYHLLLAARRDPERNRLTDLYVDRIAYTLHRAVAHDHLYTEGRAIPERFEIVFGRQADVPVIVAIHGRTEFTDLGADGREPLQEVNYRFEDIAFPAALPDWYFEPRTYGDHRAEFPE